MTIRFLGIAVAMRTPTTRLMRLLAAMLVASAVMFYLPRSTFFAYILDMMLGLATAVLVAPRSHRREFTAATAVVWLAFAVWAAVAGA